MMDKLFEKTSILKAIEPKNLQINKAYLCGQSSLVSEIYWILGIWRGDKMEIVYDEQNLSIGLKQREYIEEPEEAFLCSPNGWNEDWLIFELPNTVETLVYTKR
jgi:hypothetical protein